MLSKLRSLPIISLQQQRCSVNLNSEGEASLRRPACQIASGAGHNGHAINTRHPKMERLNEKQPAASTSPEPLTPALPSVATAGQITANLRTERSDATGGVERPLPL